MEHDIRTAHPLTALLATSPLLARYLYAFNFCPANYLHPTQRQRFGGDLLSEEVWQAKRARAALSAHILKTLSLDDKPCFDLHQREWPLILLDTDRLGRLQRHVSALIFGPVIRRSIVHADVVAWKARLGPDAYKFALSGTSLLPRMELPKTIGNPPEAEAVGYGWIEAAMSTAPEPILSRAKLKLPFHCIAPATDTATAQRLVYVLLSILEPEWRLLFPANRM
jgi:type III secretion protein K